MTTKKIIQEPKGDVTRTARAKAHLNRLTEAKGKRLVVDLAAPAREALDDLLASGYEATLKAVVSKAILAAAAAQPRKKT